VIRHDWESGNITLKWGFSAILLMSLTQQIEQLVKSAPDDLQKTMATLAPALATAAKKLRLQYFVGVGATGQWIATTLQNRQSQQEITVVYGFANVSDLQAFYQESANSVTLPVIDLLFQLTALDDIDRLVFFDSADFSQGKPVSKLDLQRSIELQLKSATTLPPEHFC
jgi:hypothetical protein